MNRRRGWIDGYTLLVQILTFLIEGVSLSSTRVGTCLVWGMASPIINRRTAIAFIIATSNRRCQSVSVYKI